MKILILDDDDIRHRKFAQWFVGYDVTHVFTIEQFRAYYLTGAFDYTFLDHDLNDNQYKSMVQIDGDDIPEFVGQCRKELTGKDAAEIIAKDPDRAGHIVIHSWNPYGAQDMIKILGNHPHGVTRWSFDPKFNLKLK